MRRTRCHPAPPAAGRRRTLVLGVAALALGLTAAACGGSGASSSKTSGGYLALGDSVVFGYQPPEATPKPDYTKATNFVGYPELVAAAEHQTLTNASCPGETSESLRKGGVQSNGCENSVGSPQGYRTAYPLHAAYAGTQEQFAVDFLKAHRQTSLVSVGVGANDAFVCQATTPSKCTGADFLRTTTAITANVRALISALRGEGGYQGRILLVDYYSLSYSDPTQVVLSKALNGALGDAAKSANVSLVDGYGAFDAASAKAGGDPCKAGLLIPIGGGKCDIHPSRAGQQALAGAVSAAAGSAPAAAS